MDGQGVLWAVTKKGLIFRRIGPSKWQKVTGYANDISIGSDGSVFILGLKEIQGGYEILKYHEKSTVKDSQDLTVTWRKINGGAKRLAVSSSGRPYAVSLAKRIYWPDEPCEKKTADYDRNDFFYYESKVDKTYIEAEIFC